MLESTLEHLRTTRPYAWPASPQPVLFPRRDTPHAVESPRSCEAVSRRGPLLGGRMLGARWLAAVVLLGTLLGTALVAAPLQGQKTLERRGTYATGFFDEGAAESAAFDPVTKRVFVTNAATGTVDIVDASDVNDPVLFGTIPLTGLGDEPTGLAFHGGVLAVTLVAEEPTDPGHVAFFDAAGDSLGLVQVGSLPDNAKFTSDGRFLVVANEAEPNDDYTLDPVGSVSIVSTSALPGGMVSQQDVRTAGFEAWDGREAALRQLGVRIFGPGASASQDLEPENVGLSPDGRTAYVTLQENNALAVVDVRRARVRRIVPLGYKPHFVADSGIDASNKDEAINIARWPVLGMYQPDGVAAYRSFGRTYLVVANEGDARDYDGFSEEARVKDLSLRGYLASLPGLQEDEQLGRLKVTTAAPFGKTEEGYGALFSYGARSFSILSSSGRRVFDSGDAFERIVAEREPDFFNTTDDENEFDGRSDDKGPEPEGLVLGVLEGRTFAFITLERQGGIMIYDVSRPWAPVFQDFVNNRDFTGEPEAGTAGDLGPEGLIFVSPSNSPNGEPLLIVANEISGTTTIYAVTDDPGGS